MAEEEPVTTAQPAAAVGDYTRYVQFMYLAGIALATWLTAKIMSTTWMAFGEPMTSVVYPVSLAAALGLGVFLWRHKRVKERAFEVIAELSKVTWPTRKELYAAVVAVIVVSIVVSIILFFFDAFWSWATTKIYLL